MLSNLERCTKELNKKELHDELVLNSLEHCMMALNKLNELVLNSLVHYRKALSTHKMVPADKNIKFY